MSAPTEGYIVFAKLEGDYLRVWWGTYKDYLEMKDNHRVNYVAWCPIQDDWDWTLGGPRNWDPRGSTNG